MNNSFAPRPERHGDEPDDQRDVLAQHLRGLSHRTLTIALSLLPILALVNVGILIWSLGRIDLASTIVAPGYLALAAMLTVVPMVANSLRLALWARFLGLKLGVLGGLRVMTGTIITNSLTPSTVGGMPIKMLFLMGEGIETKKAVTLLSFQTAEDMLVIFSLINLCASLSGFVLYDFLLANPQVLIELRHVIDWATSAVLIAGIVILALGLAVASGVLGKRLRRLGGQIVDVLCRSASTVLTDWGTVMREGKKYALANIALALTQWSVRFSVAGFVLAAFGFEWHPQLYWLLQYLVQALSSVVPTPGGSGGAEAAFLLLFSPFVDLDLLLPTMSTWRLLHFFLPLSIAAIGYFILRRIKKHKLERRSDPVFESGLPAE